MGITFGDHLIDCGCYDITPEQEREIEAREECERRGIDPNELCADGGVETWMVVAQELAQRPFSLIFPGRRLPQREEAAIRSEATRPALAQEGGRSDG